MKMSALLSRNASSRPGITGTARVDRDIDKLLRRLSPGDIAVMDAQDLDRVTADALVEANVAAVVNASSSRSWSPTASPWSTRPATTSSRRSKTAPESGSTKAGCIPVTAAWPWAPNAPTLISTN